VPYLAVGLSLIKKMSKRFLTNIDLTKNQILNVALQNLATPPTNPVSGQIYYNTTDKVIYFWRVTNDPNPGDGEWVNIAGGIDEVIAGDGLSGGGTTGAVTLDLNPDNITIEVDSITNEVRIKDLGVDTAQLADDAVTTIKITDKNITFAKIQDIASMTVIGRVASGTGVSSEIGIVDDLDNASSTTLATSEAIKLYVDGTVAALGNLEGGWDASTGTFPVGSHPEPGTFKGDYWYVIVAGTVDGVPFNVGDVIIAKIDDASTTDNNDWIQLETNRDQATETVLGLVKIATQAQTDAGIDDTAAITPLKLKTLLDNRVGGFSTNVGNNSDTSFVLTHALDTKDVIVAIYDNSTEEEVITDVATTTVNSVTVSFAIAPSTNAYRVVIKK
jgi:hypothetical protein